jgi:hypothetical protein
MSKASDVQGSAPVVKLGAPVLPKGTVRNDDGALVCSHCGHKVSNLVENGSWDLGDVGHVCDANLSIGYRSVQPQVNTVPSGWILVSVIYSRLEAEMARSGNFKLRGQYHRAQGGDGGVREAPIPQFQYVYLGGDAHSGKGGRKYQRDLSIAEILRLLKLGPDGAKTEFAHEAATIAHAAALAQAQADAQVDAEINAMLAEEAALESAAPSSEAPVVTQ